MSDMPNRISPDDNVVTPLRASNDGAGEPPIDGEDEPIAAKGDKLAQALSNATKVLGVPRSVAALTTGLVLDGGDLGLLGMADAALRAGILLDRKEAKLSALKAIDLPALVMLDDGSAVVLRRKIAGRNEVEVFAKAPLTMEEVEASYGGAFYRLALDPNSYDVGEQGPSDGGLKSWMIRSLKVDWPIYAIVLAATMVINILGVASPLFIMAVYDRILPTGAMESLVVLVLGLGLAVVLEIALRQMRSYMTEVTGRRLSVPVSNNVFARVLGLRMASRRGSSGAVANAVRDLDSLLGVFQTSTVAVLGDLPFLMVFVLVMYQIAGPLAYVLVVLIPVVLLLSGLIQLAIMKQSRKHHMMAAHRNSVMFDILGGMESLKAAGAESWAAAKWERSFAASLASRLPVNALTAFNGNLIHGARAIATISIVYLGVTMVLEGELSQGGLIAAVMLSGRAIAPLGTMVQAFGRVHSAVTAYEALKPILAAEVERPDDAQFIYHPRVEGQIEFENVDMAYPKPPGVPEELYPTINVLKQVNLKIYQGERVGIIGPVGSGKSTLLKLILGLYQPTSGMVMVDGLDVSRLEPADLRRQIGYVPQNPHFFMGSIRDNMTFHYPDASELDLKNALVISGAMKWINNCPMGLDQPVGERGEALSGGQRQTLALSRALVSQPPMLLLDEPTSMVDAKGEAEYVQYLSQSLKGKTLVIVTHRPAALALVDRLIVMDKGKIVLDGMKEEVLERLRQGQAK